MQELGTNTQFYWEQIRKNGESKEENLAMIAMSIRPSDLCTTQGFFCHMIPGIFTMVTRASPVTIMITHNDLNSLSISLSYCGFEFLSTVAN